MELSFKAWQWVKRVWVFIFCLVIGLGVMFGHKPQPTFAGTLFGTTASCLGRPSQFAMIDKSTWTMTPLSVLVDENEVYPTSFTYVSATDPRAHRFFFQTHITVPPMGQHQIVTVDTRTGAVSKSPLLGPCGFLHLGFHPGFDDVPTTHWAFSEIEAIDAAGITGGCSIDPPLFCLDAPITRGQLAVFLAKSLGFSSDRCRGRFFDVPVGHPFCPFVESLFIEGIIEGCYSATGRFFCPDESVTRGQMAVLIEAALGNLSNSCSGQFADVPVGHPFCGFIERLAQDGITRGCTATTYCPDDPVTRAQMAVFLLRAPDLLNP